MSADKKIKQLEEETQQLEAEEAKLRKQLDELLALLAELQTHIVYAIFTALKELFYIGQTEDLDERTFNHIQVALYRSSKRVSIFY
jgi:predicted  nucleic acid-binding Zn-ribbon protein